MDRVDPETRSRIMRAVKPRGTKLEATVREALLALGLEFEEQAGDLPGTPDFVLKGFRVAVFADSCFWHGCPEHFRLPGTNGEFWEAKIRKNRERDRRADAALRELGFTPVRVWEHDLKRDPVGAVAEALRAAGIPVRVPGPSPGRGGRSRASSSEGRRSRGGPTGRKRNPRAGTRRERSISASVPVS